MGVKINGSNLSDAITWPKVMSDLRTGYRSASLSGVPGHDRFVVCLAVGYGSSDGVKTPAEALTAAMELAFTDGEALSTLWTVYDRQTGQHHGFEGHESGIFGQPRKTKED